MERRWPWKKKSMDKASIDRAATAAVLESASLVSVGSIHNQISVESYKHFTELENQVKAYKEQFQTLENQVKTYEEQFQTLENQIEELNEKLSKAWSEVETKENLVKQHSKVAEDAVMGWEKAETEAIALKSQVDSLKLSKRAAEERAMHLDSTLKEYMQQIRIMKDEHAQELRDVILSKTKQWDKMKHELETKISNLDQQLLMSDAENAALSRSLQERGNLIVQINEEKSQAEEEIEFLKAKFETCEREISSLKYEIHVASKELEIRTEEKNMSVKSADVANKQYLEGVKKITKLEAECQRLRSLVRKKLPGPAALAQMRSEVEMLGRDFGSSRPRRSSHPSSPHCPLPEFNFDNLQKFQKDNELLTDRLLAMDEEMKMLKEALAKRNSELQLSRNVCAKTANRLRSLEAQLSDSKNHLLEKTASAIHSVNSMSDDGVDDSASCADSWATGSATELAQSKGDKFARPNKSDANQLELMDDFLEMEKLAHTSIDSNVFLTHPINKLTSPVKLCNPFAYGNSTSSVKEMSLNDETDSDKSPLSKLRTRILSVFESLSAEKLSETLDDTKSQLLEAEQLIAELKSQLTDAERSNSLAETQLKCMTESYRSLEKHANELETEVDHLKEKTKLLELEIQELKKHNQSCLQEQLARNIDISASSENETDYKMQQELELASAAEKLAKCQETISQLGKQFESMRPQSDIFGSPSPRSDTSQANMNDQTMKRTIIPCQLNLTDSSNSEASTLPPTPSSSKHPKHRHTMSGSSLFSTPTSEKCLGASFRRMFGSKRNT